MDYVGFSIYNRHLMGDKAMLQDFNIHGDEPEDVFPKILGDLKKMVDGLKCSISLGYCIHLCNLTDLFQHKFIKDPWLQAIKTTDFQRPFITGLHINFPHSALPLAPDFKNTFKLAMETCTMLDVDAIVLHAPLIETAQTDIDFANLMMSDDIITAMEKNDTILCWENAQDTIARYRLLEHLLHWRELLVERLESAGHEEMVDRHQFCFDTGHLLVSIFRDEANKEDQVAYLREFAKHIKVFHIQCNDGFSDQHLIPYLPAEFHPKSKNVDADAFLKNSDLILDLLNICNSGDKLDGRHIHLEVDSPIDRKSTRLNSSHYS